MSPNQPEKRKYRRINQKFVLTVAADGTSAIAPEWTLVTCQNLSAGGVLFTYDRTLKAATPLAFKIHFPDRRSIDCNGKVFRTSPRSEKPLVSVAASLEGLGMNDREYIERYVA